MLLFGERKSNPLWIVFLFLWCAGSSESGRFRFGGTKPEPARHRIQIEE